MTVATIAKFLAKIGDFNQGLIIIAAVNIPIIVIGLELGGGVHPRAIPRMLMLRQCLDSQVCPNIVFLLIRITLVWHF